MAWMKIFWGLIVMVVKIFGYVGSHWSQNTAMAPFFTTKAPIHHGATCKYIDRGLQGGSAIDQVG